MSPTPPQHGTPQPEHGDWRVPVQNPAETSQMLNPPLSVWKKLGLRASYLEQSTLSTGPLMRHYLQAADSTWEQAEESTCGDYTPIQGWSRVWRLVFTVFLLIPFSAIALMAVALELMKSGKQLDASFWLQPSVWYSLSGAFSLLLLLRVRYFRTALIYLYVVGHELSHALAARLSMGTIYELKIDQNGGYVDTDADNIVVALAPYFLPLWMLVWMLLFWLANLLVPFGAYTIYFYSGFGFWWLFHLYWTLWIVPREQPDLLENGLTFSLQLILIVNLAVLLLIMWAFGLTSWGSYWASFDEAGARMVEAVKFFLSFL